MRGLFGLRTVVTLPAFDSSFPMSPSSPLPKNAFYRGSTLPILIKERDIVERAEETTPVPNSPIFYITRNCPFLVPFIHMDLFEKNYVYSKFLAPLRFTKTYIYIYNLYYFIYLSG